MDMEQRIKVCAAHVAPVFLDAVATVAKACKIIGEAAANGARLIAFPESYVPGFPVWASLRAPIHNHEYFKAIARQSIEVPGPLTDQLCNAARRHQVFVSVGISEGTRASVGCLWNSNLLIGEDGSILNHHRKIVPTFYEKLVWANGDGAGLRVVETAIGRLGMLICGENTNPLARYALMAQGEQIHVSSYPPVWPTRDPSEGGNYDLAAAIRIRAGAHSFEGKLFNVVASAFLDVGTELMPYEFYARRRGEFRSLSGRPDYRSAIRCAMTRVSCTTTSILEIVWSRSSSTMSSAIITGSTSSS
jgi:aliphatic nitrilase